MKATLLFASLALTLAAAVSAQAQAQTPPAPPPATAPMTPPPRHAPVDFATRKADILARMDQRTAEMTQARACVTAAASKADLKACHPRGHRGHHAPA